MKRLLHAKDSFLRFAVRLVGYVLGRNPIAVIPA
jgi:hypothetical protein